MAEGEEMNNMIGLEGIRDPSEEGWLSDICPMPIERLVTCSGTRKLPGRSREYANGKAVYFTRKAYKLFTDAVIGMQLDPCEMWHEMGHDIDCKNE